MAAIIPTLDFTSSPDSFSTAYEQQSGDEWEDSSSTASVETPRSVPEPSQNEPDSKNAGWSSLAQAAELKRRGTISIQHTQLKRPESRSGQHNKLVKRPKSIKPVEALTRDSKRDRSSFRCDIHATSSTDYAAAEAACKQLVLEAGGTLIDFAYPGGLLYQLPPSTRNPLRNGDEIEIGSHISVGPWTPFPPAQFSGLKMGYRYGRADELHLLPLVRAVRRNTVAGSEKTLLGARSGVAKHVVSAWLGMFARDYGRRGSYIA